MNEFWKNVWDFFKTPITDHLKNLWNSLHDFFTSPFHTKWYAIIGIIILAVALPVIIVMSQQRTQIEQKAANQCETLHGVCLKSNFCNANCQICDTTKGCSGTVCCGTCTAQYIDHRFCCNDFGNYHYCQYFQYLDCATQKRDLGYSSNCVPPPPPKSCSDVGGTCMYNGCPYGNHNPSGTCGSQSMQCCNIPPPTPTPLPACSSYADGECQYNGCTTGTHNPPGDCGSQSMQCCNKSTACGTGVTSGASCMTASNGDCPSDFFHVGGGVCSTGSTCCKPSPNRCTAPNHPFKDASGANKTTGDATCAKYQCGGGQVSIGGDCSPMTDSACCISTSEYGGSNYTVKYTCLAATVNSDGYYSTSFKGDDGSVTFCDNRQYCNLGTWDSGGNNYISPNVKTNLGPDDAKKQLCKPLYSTGHTYPGEACAAHDVSQKGAPITQGVCLMHYDKTPSWSTTINFCTSPAWFGNLTCHNTLPKCEIAIPGTHTNYIQGNETKSCPWQYRNDYECCLYNPASSQNQCSSGQGAEGQACCANSTCNNGLTCNSSNKCEKPGSTTTPTGGGGGGGGGGESCTNGKRTQFAVNIKLPGIGGGQFENHTPANPTKHGSLVVKDSNGTVKNGQEHDFSHSFGHENGNGKLKSEHVDLGSSKYVCGQTYHVEIKIPGYVTVKKDIVYGEDQTLDISENDIIPGDIVSAGTDNVVVNGKVIGDDKVTIADYNIFKACHDNPDQVFTFTSNTTQVDLKCSDLINLFDFKDGGVGEDSNGISEFADNYNLWLRGYIKANGY